MARNRKPKGGDTSQMQKLFAEGGMMDNSGETVNGVEVPPGSLKEEVADDIPAQLSEGEFVVPADVVSHLGNGNSNAGAENLYGMMDRVRQARTGNTQQGTEINPNKFIPSG